MKILCPKLLVIHWQLDINMEYPSVIFSDIIDVMCFIIDLQLISRVLVRLVTCDY